MVNLISRGSNNSMHDFGGATKASSSCTGRMRHPPSGLRGKFSVEVFEFRTFRDQNLEGRIVSRFTKRVVETSGKKHYNIAIYRSPKDLSEISQESQDRQKHEEISERIEFYEGVDRETKEKVFFTYRGELKQGQINRYGVSLDIQIRSFLSREGIHLEYTRNKN